MLVADWMSWRVGGKVEDDIGTPGRGVYSLWSLYGGDCIYYERVVELQSTQVLHRMQAAFRSNRMVEVVLTVRLGSTTVPVDWFRWADKRRRRRGVKG
jgi:hypothetical protein